MMALANTPVKNTLFAAASPHLAAAPRASPMVGDGERERGMKATR
jgi:hypothetical protein